MHLLFRILAVVTAFATTGGAFAQESFPVIIPETLQAIAIEHGIASSLGIDWTKGDSESVGRYMGMLAAAADVARSIAQQSGREEPSGEDYLASLSAFCLWPPNKPPVVAEQWSKVYPAFYDSSVRDALFKAVGPKAVELPALIAEGEDVLSVFPIDAKAYSNEILNLQNLPE